MNPLDFIFIVLPLGLMVFLLAGALILIVKKEEGANKRKIRRMEAIIKEKTKQCEVTEKQLEELYMAYRNKSLDKDAYERLKKLVNMNAKKYEETAIDLRQLWEGMSN